MREIPPRVRNILFNRGCHTLENKIKFVRERLDYIKKYYQQGSLFSHDLREALEILEEQMVEKILLSEPLPKKRGIKE